MHGSNKHSNLVLMDSERAMKVDNEETQEQRQAPAGADGHGHKAQPHHATKRELDDEIAAIQASLDLA